MKILLWSLLLFLSLSTQASEDGALEFITIGVSPWAYSDEAGEILGAFPEIIAELEQEASVDISISVAPFARVTRELELGRKHCTIVVPLQSDHIKQGAIVALHDVGAVPAEGVDIRQYSDLHGRTVSMLRGTSVSERFDGDSAIERVYDTDYLIGLEQVSRGRVDAVVGAIPTILHVAEQEGLTESLGEPFAITQIPLTLQCSSRLVSDGLLNSLNAGIKRMIGSGFVDGVKERHHF